MIIALDMLLRLVVWLLLAPLVPGIINKVKAWVAGRRGLVVVELIADRLAARDQGELDAGRIRFHDPRRPQRVQPRGAPARLGMALRQRRVCQG